MILRIDGSCFWIQCLQPVGDTSTRILSPTDLGAGGSATMAVDVLKSKGVPEDRVLFLNLIASPEGVKSFAKRFPKLRVVTAFIDQGLDERKYMSPSIHIVPTQLTSHLATLSLDSGTSETVSTRFKRSWLAKVYRFPEKGTAQLSQSQYISSTVKCKLC